MTLTFNYLPQDLTGTLDIQIDLPINLCQELSSRRRQELQETSRDTKRHEHVPKDWTWTQRQMDVGCAAFNLWQTLPRL